MKKVHLPICNFLVVLTLVGVSRSALWYFLGFDIEKTELWSTLGVCMSATFLYQYMPASSKLVLANLIKRALGSLWTLRVALVLLVLVALPVLLTGYVEISWKGPETVEVSLNGEDLTLVAIDPDNAKKTARRYGWSLTSFDIRQGSWKADPTILPLTRQEVAIPFWVSASAMPKLVEVEDLLELVFFQYFEARYLTEAKNRLAALSKDESIRLGVERLDLLSEILRLDFLERDVSGTKTLLLQDFMSRYRQDAWEPLLRAANAYGEKRYGDCADILEVTPPHPGAPHQTTVDFFRGVCLLKSSLEQKDAASRETLGDLAVEKFRTAETRLQASTPEGVYRGLAWPSSILFQAITHYYKGRIPEALELFRRARDASTGSFRARPLNGLGYLEMSRGHLDEAESALIEAMESDPNYPVARSNYGYVLMDKGEFRKARGLFQKNAADERLKLESHRDVVLAKLAIVHLSELAGASAQEAIDGYAPVLDELKIQTFDGVSPDRLRLAFIHRALARGVYLDKHYYGLEIYALALLTRSSVAARQALAKDKSDAKAGNLVTALDADISKTKLLVSADWLNRPRRGWFASIDEHERLTGERPALRGSAASTPVR
jgi:tetratricopeptide (TPR) repeat protein